MGEENHNAETVIQRLEQYAHELVHYAALVRKYGVTEDTAKKLDDALDVKIAQQRSVNHELSLMPISDEWEQVAIALEKSPGAARYYKQRGKHKTSKNHIRRKMHDLELYRKAKQRVESDQLEVAIIRHFDESIAPNRVYKRIQATKKLTEPDFNKAPGAKLYAEDK